MIFVGVEHEVEICYLMVSISRFEQKITFVMVDWTLVIYGQVNTVNYYNHLLATPKMYRSYFLLNLITNSNVVLLDLYFLFSEIVKYVHMWGPLKLFNLQVHYFGYGIWDDELVTVVSARICIFVVAPSLFFW